jgi:hydrogenase maturation protein HypF
MADNGLDERVIGVVFDGTGFGSDGQIWGGEFFVCDFKGFQRFAHLRYVPLPGGDRAARQPWRMAAAHLSDALGTDYRKLDLPCWSAPPPPAWKLLDQLIKKPALLTSSCGRLFDAVAAICGISDESSYEGESAMLLEAASHGQDSDETYQFDLQTAELPWIIDTRQMLMGIGRDVASGRSPQLVSHCFHNSIARMIDLVCSRIRERSGLDKVCLSGGTFQNSTLLTRAVGLLRRSGFRVYLHSKVPPNDGGLSLGQAAIAANSLPKDIVDVPSHTG